MERVNKFKTSDVIVLVKFGLKTNESEISSVYVIRGTTENTGEYPQVAEVFI